MKKQISSILLLLSSACLLAACGEGKSENPSNDSGSSLVEPKIILSQTSVSLEQYESITLTYELQNLSGPVTWGSSDNSVASVSNGKVEALKTGNCVIVASIGGVRATCDVTVKSISQAPRIVMSDLEVSIGKDETYSIDAYVLYKGEIIDATLEMESDDIASLTYENSKIKVVGLKYGQSSYVIHTKAKGVTLSQTLKVNVVNSDLHLALGNLEDGENGYELNLATYKMEGEDGYETEFTPEIVFTEGENKATYALKYVSSDESVAVWEDGKIVAKAKGEAILKVVCEEFAMSLEINVHVAKGAYDVTLKNVTADGANTSVKVASNKLPSAPEDIAGHKFIGWYNEEGEKVDKVNDDMTLVARWSATHFNENNDAVLKLTNNDTDYTQPSEATWKYAVRGETDRDSDITSEYYPGGDGSQGFLYPNSMSVVAGLGLPAYDFSAATSPIGFTFGFSGSVSSVKLNNTAIGDLATKSFYNYTVTIDGQNVTVSNAYTGANTSITLDNDTYHGRKGLEITLTGANWRWLYVSPFRTFDCDYLGVMSAIEDALPDAAVDGYAGQISEYKSLMDLMTSYEKTANPLSAKMKAWVEAYTPFITFTDNSGIVSSSSGFDCSSDKKTAAKTAGSLGENLPFSLGDDYFVGQVNNLSSAYATLTFPKINYSEYSKVSFTFGLGGNGGGGKMQYFLGAAPDSYSASPSADNFIGLAPETTTRGWELAEDTKVTISNGKISFVGTYIKKEFTLDENVNNGTAALTLSLGGTCWEFFVISPITGIKA